MPPNEPVSSRHTLQNCRYPRFASIDGRHPLRAAVPRGHVDYAARRRHDGEVVYFNFALAREMGLVPPGHPDRMNRTLARAVLDAFCLVIINEHDLEHGLEVPERDRLPHPFMATRYLQLQHPGRRGRTSGDGRSVWNGCLRHNGITWDVTSCGTGVTRLCPATAEQQRFFKTGTRLAEYGCGTAALAEGMADALMSEVFYRNGVPTERVLAVIGLPQGLAITVRAARNLLRPSHFFVHLKQGDLASLRGVADYYAARQIANGDWPKLREGVARYRYLADEAARSFARAAATFESEYIFCWLDWDGDNILVDGGIIDYGSVRQFGLFHREYRFEDVDRMSTTIPEQRRKARHIAQNFAQIRDYLCTGHKAPLASFAHDPVLEIFDREFALERRRRLLANLGLPPQACRALLRSTPPALETFRKAHAYFERARSSRGPLPVPDGVSWDAIFSTRDLLRELPERFRRSPEPLPPEAFLEIARSSYARTRADRAATPHRMRMAQSFQRSYLALLGAAARAVDLSLAELLAEVEWRSAVLNRRDRITGDSIDLAVKRLILNRSALPATRMYRVVERFVAHQHTRPQRRRAPQRTTARSRELRVLQRLLRVVEELREGLKPGRLTTRPCWASTPRAPSAGAARAPAGARPRRCPASGRTPCARPAGAAGWSRRRPSGAGRSRRCRPRSTPRGRSCARPTASPDPSSRSARAARSRHRARPGRSG